WWMVVCAVVMVVTLRCRATTEIYFGPCFATRFVDISAVMAGLVPAIHALRKTWMPGTRPGMTTKQQQRKLGPRRKAVRYTPGEVRRARVVEDFLPSLEALVAR